MKTYALLQDPSSSFVFVFTSYSNTGRTNIETIFIADYYQSLDFWNYRTWSGLAKCRNCIHFFFPQKKIRMYQNDHIHVHILVLLNTAQTLPVGCYTVQSVWTVRLFPLDFKVSIFDQLLYINFIKFVFEMHLYLKCCAGLVVIGSTPGLF